MMEHATFVSLGSGGGGGFVSPDPFLSRRPPPGAPIRWETTATAAAAEAHRDELGSERAGGDETDGMDVARVKEGGKVQGWWGHCAAE